MTNSVRSSQRNRLAVGLSSVCGKCRCPLWGLRGIGTLFPISQLGDWLRVDRRHSERSCVKSSFASFSRFGNDSGRREWSVWPCGVWERDRSSLPFLEFCG